MIIFCSTSLSFAMRKLSWAMCIFNALSHEQILSRTIRQVPPTEDDACHHIFVADRVRTGDSPPGARATPGRSRGPKTASSRVADDHANGFDLRNFPRGASHGCHP